MDSATGITGIKSRRFTFTKKEVFVVSFPCPFCGASTRTRTSRAANDTGTVRWKLCQCNNPECSLSFSTLESFDKITVKRYGSTSQDIPWQSLPASHRGDAQLSLPFPVM
ncbi:ogr/Delta-like zinc finger family protein [Escherichia coli]|nr:ogr/Delta-like zinc finger family protein [Escherichia coli]